MARDESWLTPPEHDGWRLDRAVAVRESVGARRRARDVVESGKVSVGGQRCTDPGRRLAAGDAVMIEWDRPGTGHAHRRARAAVAGAGVTILHEDAAVLAVDKPPGLLTDAATRRQSRADDTLTDRLGRYLRSQDKQAIAAHRIDRDTSGVVLFAKDGGAFDALRSQFHARTPERVYLAVVEGRPADREGVWVDWMAWDKDRLLQVAAEESTPGAVRAEAHYRVDSVTAGVKGRLSFRT